MAVRFIGQGNRNIRRKPPTCRKLLISFMEKDWGYQTGKIPYITGQTTQWPKRQKHQDLQNTIQNTNAWATQIQLENGVKMNTKVLCLVYPMLPVSLDCLFLIAPSVFSNVYFDTTDNHSDNYIVCWQKHVHTLRSSNTWTLNFKPVLVNEGGIILLHLSL